MGYSREQVINRLRNLTGFTEQEANEDLDRYISRMLKQCNADSSFPMIKEADLFTFLLETWLKPGSYYNPKPGTGITGIWGVSIRLKGR